MTDEGDTADQSREPGLFRRDLPTPAPSPLGLDFDAQLSKVQRARMRHECLPREPDVVHELASSFADLSDRRAAMRRVRDEALAGRAPVSDDDKPVLPLIGGEPSWPLGPLYDDGPSAKRGPDAVSKVLGTVVKAVRRWF